MYDMDMQELLLVTDQSELLYTDIMLNEKTLMSAYEAAGAGSILERFLEWWKKVLGFVKKQEVLLTAQNKKLELTHIQQKKQWDTVKQDLTGKEPYKIDVTKNNFMLNDQGVAWYSDQCKQINAWVDQVCKASPEFNKALKAALDAAKAASDVAGVNAAMDTLTGAVKTYYTVVGTKLPEYIPIKVDAEHASIASKNTEELKNSWGKYFQQEKVTATVSSQYIEGGLAAVDAYLTMANSSLDKNKSSQKNYDAGFGSAKNEVGNVLNKFSDQKDKQAAARAMSKFMRAFKQGCKINQQITSTVTKALATANVLSGVVGKALNHFASGGKNKEQNAQKETGNEMFQPETYGFAEDYDLLMMDDVMSFLEKDGALVGTEGFFLFDWIKKFFKWLSSLIFGEEKQVGNTVASIEKSKALIEDLEKIKEQKILKKNFSKNNGDFRLLFAPGVITKVGQALSQCDISRWDPLFDKLHNVSMETYEQMGKLDARKDPIPADIAQKIDSVSKSFLGKDCEFMSLLQTIMPFKPQSLEELKNFKKLSTMVGFLKASPLTSVKVPDVKILLEELQNLPKDVFKEYIDSCDHWKELDRKYEATWSKWSKEQTPNIKIAPEWKKACSTLDTCHRNMCAVYAAIYSAHRVLRTIITGQLTALRLLCKRKIIPLIKKAGKDTAQESFSSQLITAEGSVDLLSDETLDYIQKKMDEELLYIQTVDYLQIGEEGFFSAIADFIGKILKAIGDFFSRLFGGSSGSSSSSESSSEGSSKTTKKVKQAAAQSKEVAEIDQQISEAGKAIDAAASDSDANTKSKSPMREIIQLFRTRILPIVEKERLNVEIPESLREILATEANSESISDNAPDIREYLEQIRKSEFFDEFGSVFNWVLVATGNPTDTKTKEYLAKYGTPKFVAHCRDISQKVRDITKACFTKSKFITSTANGSIKVSQSQDKKERSFDGNITFKDLHRLLSDDYTIRTIRSNHVVGDIPAMCKNLAEIFQQELSKIRKSLAAIDSKFGAKQSKRLQNLKQAVLVLVKTAAILSMNIMRLSSALNQSETRSNRIVRAWVGIYRTYLSQVFRRISEETRKLSTEVDDPKKLRRAASVVVAELNKKLGKTALLSRCAQLVKRTVQESSKDSATESFGKPDFFWFLDDPHISDEKALEMFEQLVSDDTIDKVQKQVDAVVNSDDSDPSSSGSDLRLDVTEFEHQLALFKHGGLQAGQEGFFDAALRLLTSLGDLVSRLFSTFKLVYRAFQGLKRTEYHSYKEKYAVTLMRARRQPFSEVAGLQMPHPKGLTTTYADVLSKLIATLQACDMVNRSKSFACTAKNIKTQLTEGVSTDATVGALYVQSNEIQHIKDLWEKTDKCFRGSGNTAEFSVLYKSMDEFNSVLDSLEPACQFEYDVSKVYSYLEECNEHLQLAVKAAKQRKAGDGLQISKAELVSVSEACMFMAKTFDMYGLTLQLENRVQHNVIEDVKTIVRVKKL